MTSPKRSLVYCFLPTCLGIVLSWCLVNPAFTTGQDAAANARKPIILIPPFENQSSRHETIDYEIDRTAQNLGKRVFRVDRYCQAPRSLFENAIGNIEGVTIVERQRVDTLLVESEFGQLSGLVDSEKALKLGKLLGANVIIVGTITDFSEESQSFSGYGVSTENVTVSCQLRVRILDAETGKVAFSNVGRGSKKYSRTNFGQTKSSDRNWAAVEAAIAKVGEDASFRQAIFGKKPEGKNADGLVEVDFAPKPDNCEIEIDGKYVGGSPLKKKLKAGTDYKIKISKNGFVDWNGIISAEEGLRVTLELHSKQ